MQQLSITNGASLTPKKLAVAFAATREFVTHSNAEKLLRQLVAQSVGAAVDLTLFDANPATATRPAGLRNGIAGLTATAGGTTEAMIKDLVALGSAVSGVGGTDIVFVAHPTEAIKNNAAR